MHINLQSHMAIQEMVSLLSFVFNLSQAHVKFSLRNNLQFHVAIQEVVSPFSMIVNPSQAHVSEKRQAYCLGNLVNWEQVTSSKPTTNMKLGT